VLKIEFMPLLPLALVEPDSAPPPPTVTVKFVDKAAVKLAVR
jgi:hypothetical protein